jgi:hypothetical protein
MPIREDPEAPKWELALFGAYVRTFLELWRRDARLREEVRALVRAEMRDLLRELGEEGGREPR